MKKRKIRGNKRRLKAVEQWKAENLLLRFDLIEKYGYDNIDIIVHPWCDIYIINSEVPEPKGKIKQLMIGALIDIYHSWQQQLEQLGTAYYLKVWLYDPRFSKSQVVCAVGDKINYYENLFSKAEDIKQFNISDLKGSKNKLDNVNWSCFLDEDHFDNNELGTPEHYSTPKDYEETKAYFNRMLLKPHKTTIVNQITEVYSFEKGRVWVGGQ